MNKPPTIRDVAELSGLSINTISRVVNGKAHVSPKARAKALQAIQELGYRTNPVARSLRLGRDQTIGVVIASIADPFFSEVGTAIEETARERGYSAIISCTGEKEEEEEAIVLNLLNRQVAGLILAPTGASESYIREQFSRVPIVAIDRPTVGFECDTVVTDNEGGAQVATNWLISHGHRRIAFVGGPHDKFTIANRLIGYKRALHDAGIPFDPTLVADHAVRPSEVALTVPALIEGEAPATAIFSSNSKASLGVVEALHGRGRTGVAMVGFDDFFTAASLTPPLTIVNQYPAQYGKEAVGLLLRRILGESDGEPERIVVPTSLVIRGSGEIRPVG